MTMVLLLYATFVAILLYALYNYLTKYHDYFERRNIAYLKPTLFGHTIGLYLKRYDAPSFIRKLNENFPNEK